MQQRFMGAGLVIVASVLWSTAGLFVRTISLDPWTMLAWRSMFSFVTLAVIAVAATRRRNNPASSQSLRVGWRELLYIPFGAVSMLSYILALKLTSVANVMVIYATVPFLAAGFGFLLMRECMDRSVLVASCVAFIGICISTGSALTSADIQGNAIALGMTICFAVTVVLARKWPWLNLTWVTALAAALCAIVCLPFASRTLPSVEQLWVLLLFSLATQSIGYLLFLLGARLIPSAQAGLIALLDVVLSPLWVLWAVHEVPSRGALLGGVIILAALAWYLARESRRRMFEPG